MQQACRDLVLRAVACVDAKDYQGFVELFAPSGQLLRPNAPVLHGREAILAFYRTRPIDRITRHLVTNTLVQLSEDETQARATSYVLLWAGVSGDTPGPVGRPAHNQQILGEFEDLLVWSVDGWRFLRREVKFVLSTGL